MKEESMLKYLIAIPCGNNMPTPTVAALVYMNRVGMSRVSFLQNSMVYDARHILIAEALDTGVDRVLFIDSDMTFDCHLMERLAEDMDEGRDLVTALYFRRIFPTNPLLFKSVEFDGEKSHNTIYTDYPRDCLFEIEGCGFGAVMISAKLLKDMMDTYEYPFEPKAGVFGEDIAFCWRAKQLGYKLWCDSRIKAGHVGHYIYGESAYMAQPRGKD